MPKAARKSNQIAGDLIDLLREKTKLDDFSFHKYFREIEKLNDRFSEDYLKALACAANGRVAEAIEYFELSLNYGGEEYATNYAVFISEYGSHKDLLALINRLVERFFSKTLMTFGWETNLFTGNIESAVSYGRRFISASEEKEAELMRSDVEGILHESEKFKKNANLTDEEYKDIAHRMMEVADNYGVHAASLSFCFVPEENTSAYILTMKTNDVDVLSDMNIDIAFSLAENDLLVGKKFSVWFQPYGEVNNNAGN